MNTVTVQLSDDDLEAVDTVADLLERDRHAVFQQAIHKGLDEIRLAESVRQYRHKDVSANQAARIADLSLADWLVVANERGLTTQLTPANLDADADAVDRL